MEFEAIPGSGITLQDIKENMQAIRISQNYVEANIEKGQAEYHAMQTVIMRAIEQVADIAEAMGFDDICELETALFGNSFITTIYKREGRQE